MVQAMTKNPIGAHQKPHLYVAYGRWVCLYKGRLAWGTTALRAYRGWFVQFARVTGSLGVA